MSVFLIFYKEMFDIGLEVVKMWFEGGIFLDKYLWNINFLNLICKLSLNGFGIKSIWFVDDNLWLEKR